MEIYSVADVTRYVKLVLEDDPQLQNLWIEGEVSNFVISAAGHAYFTLKDSTSQIRCVMFRRQLSALAKLLQNGDAVVVHGRVSVYEAQGAYQFYADQVHPAGVGLLHRLFEELRAKLEHEGLFDPGRKRSLPPYPRCIGVVTSPQGAVLHDIINVIRRRFPLVELIVVPTLVQGEEAAASICRALRAANDCAGIELIIVARGGGSLEDLWPFNEEVVARAIYASRVPVVTGIGHETDYTIADMVSDLRAPTPSAAAELVVPDRRECLATVEGLRRDLVSAYQIAVDAKRQQLEGLSASLGQVSPLASIARHRQAIDDLSRRAELVVRRDVLLRIERVKSRDLQLKALEPLGVLSRGYSQCLQRTTGRVISSVADVGAGDLFQVRVVDGEFAASVQPDT